jgi:sulfatase maturation enzyme AslB (radical SAM superfamily)
MAERAVGGHDLLFGATLRAEWAGLAETERTGASRWRWALGAEQTVRFPGFSRRIAVYFEISLPKRTQVVTIYANGRAAACLRATKDNETARGFFAFECGAEAEIRFVSTAYGAAGGDERALAFLLRELEVARASAPETRELPESLCAFPFAMSFVEHPGRPGPCCWSPVFRDESAGGSDPASGHWNHPELRALRTQHLAGEKPRSCAGCYAKEAAGGRSLRQYFNEEYLALALARIEATREDGFTPQAPIGLDLRMGNTCNLKCRMCFPSRSSLLQKEFEAIYGRSFTADVEAGRWLREPGRMEALLQACAKLEELRIVGGEPFVMPEFAELLAGLERRNLSSKLRLVLNTNATVLRDDVLAAFRRFREVVCIVSLEGVGEVNDYIRYPSQFGQIEANLRRLYDERERLGIIRLEFATTVQIYNVFHLPELLAYLRKNFPRARWLPLLTILFDPPAFSAAVLPSAARAAAVQGLREFLAGEAKAWEDNPGAFGRHSLGQLREAVGSVIRYLETTDHSAELPRFRELHEAFDRARGQAGRWRAPYSASIISSL